MIDMSSYHINENDADQIIPNLWLGNKRSALDKNFMRANNINYIVNVTDTIPCAFSFITYYHIPIKDKKMCKSHNRETMFTYIKYAMEFIFNGLISNKGVLVHCKKGHHRSANVVLIFLMKYLNIGYIPAMIHINNIRPYSLKRNACINKWVINYYRNDMLQCNYKK